MEAVKTIAIPESLHRKLKQIALNRNDIPISKLIAEILQKEVGK